MKRVITIEQLEREVEKIAEYIISAKIEIAAISLPEEKTGNDKNLAHATLELNEVVRHTEEATNTIMDNAEAVMMIASNLGEEGAKAAEHAVAILEACSFQDITGQRIGKVLRTLEQIELRVGNLVRLFGGKLPEGFQVDELESALHQRRADEDLMSGPQLSSEKPSQDDIDKLFASF